MAETKQNPEDAGQVDGENELNLLFSASRLAALPLADRSKSMDHERLAQSAKYVLSLLHKLHQMQHGTADEDGS